MSAPESPAGRWPSLRAHGPVLALAAAVLVVLAVNTRIVFSSLHNATFQTDAWEILNDGRTWRGFLAAEWRHIFDGRDRFRPTTHLMFVLYVRLFGVDAEGFARALWGLVQGLLVAQGVYLTKLGFKVETALLASVLLLFTPAYLGTTYAHQYNDLILAAVFMFAALNVCLRPARQPVWLVLALAIVGVGAHESGVLAGPLLVLSHLYVSGPRSWRAWGLRPDTLALLTFTTGYALLRFSGGAAVSSGLVGSSAIVHNYQWLLAQAVDWLLHPPRHPLALLDPPRQLAVVLLRRPQTLLAPLALLALWRGPAGWRAGRVAAFALAWLVVSYGPYALNPRYGSVTYACVSMLLPAVALLFPSVEWASAPGRHPLLRTLGLLTLLAVVYPFGIHINLRFSDRLAGPLLRAIVARAAAAPPRAPVAVWIVESQRVPNAWGRSPIDEELQMMPTRESLAVRQMVPDRVVHVAVIDAATAPTIRPRRDDLVLVAEGHNPRYRLWAFPQGGGAPTLLFGQRPAGAAPPSYPLGARAP
ncbi:MAG: hypothetical protein Q8S73_10010 [Deltaproteobacteria bacterium]|nr:hypothetical protein [Deltaproteobacteria bacterium]